MADLDAAVLDTHPLVFHAAGTGRLGAKASALFTRCEAGESVLYVPTPVIWECTLLARAARVNLRRSVREFFTDLFSNPAYQPLELTPEHVYAADALRFNRDPFDALIVATAQTIDLPLVTRDDEIRRAGMVAVIW